MTRVEKYRKYRQEIANMKVDDFSSKKETVDQLENIKSKKVDYDKVIDIHEKYESDDEFSSKKGKFHLSKYKVCYYLIALLVIAILVVGIIIVANNLWGK